MHAVRSRPWRPDLERRTFPNGIAITRGGSAIAESLCKTLLDTGYSARLIDAARGDESLLVITDALANARNRALADIRMQCLAHAQTFIAGASDSQRRIIFLESGDRDRLNWSSGLPGLARTLRRERPDLEAGSVSLMETGAATISTLARIVVANALPDEISQTAAGNWETPSILSMDAPSGNRPSITSDDTLLVTGGGQGITAACAIALAEDTGARFILAGRTELSSDPWPGDLPADASETELKRTLAQKSLVQGERPSPAAVAKSARTLVANRSIRETIATIEAAGGQATYVPLDLSDDQAVKRTLDNLQRRSGPITGLIHGAGILADRALADLRREDVARVFAPKVDGFRHVVDALIGKEAQQLADCQPAQLRHIVLFGSAAARFGNAGQANYAMANQTLCQVANDLQIQYPDLAVRHFSWGPWDSGMVTDGLKRAFRDRGIELIPVDAGARVFSELMRFGPDDVEVCVGAL